MLLKIDGIYTLVIILAQKQKLENLLIILPPV
jgi:hypothetical protein